MFIKKTLQINAYGVRVKIKDLLAEKDQLANKRLYLF